MNEEENNVTSNGSSNISNERNGFNITSMILGIISVVGFCFWYVSIPCSIIAIIFSVAGRKDAGRGMGIAGMVLGIIALALWIVFFALAMIGIAAYPEILNTAY